MVQKKAKQPTGAIQVVEGKKENVFEGTKCKPQVVLRTIPKYKSGPSLEEILLHPDVKDLPVLVFSICGKTRGGKSFLLNTMIMYLESLETKSHRGDWLTGTVPDYFPWSGGLNSVTRGLWIWPKVYKITNSDNIQVGVLLMDNEGLFDGEATDGEMIAMSGISTAISYLQMLNIKEKITADCLESIVLYLAKGIEEVDGSTSSEIKDDLKLMFLVRDWTFEEDHPCGLDGGQAYLEHDSNRGSTQNVAMWSEVRRTFNNIQCLLLPHPGLDVVKRQFSETGDLTVPDQHFLREVKKFIETLFSHERLMVPRNKLTGSCIHNLLMKADGKKADENLSFLNMFTDYTNFDKMDKLKSAFESKLSEISLTHLNEAKALMEGILSDAQRTLRGQSAEHYLSELKKVLEMKTNGRVVECVSRQYEESFEHMTTAINKNHEMVWKNVLVKLGEFVCGDKTSKGEAKKAAAQRTAEVYYIKLLKEVEIKFKEVVDKFITKCEKKVQDLQNLVGFDEETMRIFQECTDFQNLAGSHGAVYGIWLKQKQCLKAVVDEGMLKMIEKVSKIETKYLKEARKRQYEYFEAFNLLIKKDSVNWDSILKNNIIILQKKIGFAMFGLPVITTETEYPVVPEESNSAKHQIKEQTISSKADKPSSTLIATAKNITSNAITMVSKSKDNSDKPKIGYSDSQMKQINVVADQIITLSVSSDTIKFSCIFVTFLQDKEIVSTPLFKILSVDSSVKYVDTNGRVYPVWEEFLASNNLPDVVYCYPLNGSYDKTSGFSVAFRKSPASTLKAKALKVTDFTGDIVSVSAGVAGGLTLGAAAIGAALAPAVGTIAVVAGGAAGMYGVARGVFKVKDKYKHGQSIRKDAFDMASNTFSALSMGAGAVVEKFAVGAVRVAQVLIVCNAVRVFISSNDTPNMTSLLEEIANSSKILFYFNTDCSSKAIEVIRTAFTVDGSACTVQVLDTLLQFNSIESTIESGGTIKVEKYVSEGVTTLVTSLLKTVSPEVKHMVLLLKDIEDAFCENKKESLSMKDMREKVTSIMEKLQTNLNSETKTIVERVTSVALKLENYENLNNFIEFLTNEKNNCILVMAVRYLVCSIISSIREANRFYNNIEHKANSLPGYDVDFHPLKEVTGQIINLMEQSQCAADLTSRVDEVLDHFIKKVLALLLEKAEPKWSSPAYGNCLQNISQRIYFIFQEKLKRAQHQVSSKHKNLKCSDLEIIFQEIGKHGNYGASLLQEVLDDFEVNENDLENKDSSVDFTMLPVWNGLVDCLYCYSSTPIDLKKDFIKKLNNCEEGNYSVHSDTKEWCVLMPCVDNLPTYFIYSTAESAKSGLVWRHITENKKM